VFQTVCVTAQAGSPTVKRARVALSLPQFVPSEAGSNQIYAASLPNYCHHEYVVFVDEKSRLASVVLPAAGFTRKELLSFPLLSV
jgi:hypothetical protein